MAAQATAREFPRFVKDEDANWAQSILDEGWNPYDQSSECAAVMARPSGLAHLPWTDSAGIQWVLNFLKLAARFRRTQPDNEVRDRYLLWYAHLFLLVELRCEVEWNPQEMLEQIRQVDDWIANRLVPARERMDADAALGIDHLCSRRAQYEPAITFMMLQEELGISDAEGDRLRMFFALEKYNDEGTLPRKGEKVSYETLYAAFGLAIADGRAVTKFDKDGRLVLVDWKVVDGLQANVHRNVEADDRCSPATDLGDEHRGADVFERDEELETPLSENEKRDLAEAARLIVAQRITQGGLPRATGIVLSSLEMLAQGEVTLEDLGTTHGISAQALGKALKQERAAIAAQLAG